MAENRLARDHGGLQAPLACLVPGPWPPGRVRQPRLSRLPLSPMNHPTAAHSNHVPLRQPV